MNPVKVVGVGAVVFAASGPVMGLFVPNVYEVRSQEVTHNAAGIRHALSMGAAVVVGLGLAGSVTTGNLAPLMGALLGVGLVWGVYEWALRNPHKEA